MRRVCARLPSELPPVWKPPLRQSTISITPPQLQAQGCSLERRVHMFADHIELRGQHVTPRSLAQWVDRQFWKARAPLVGWEALWGSPEEGCQKVCDLYRIVQGKTPMAEAMLGRNLSAVRTLLAGGWNAVLEQDLITWEARGREGRESAMGFMDALCRGFGGNPEGFDETVIRELIASGVPLSGLLCAAMDSSHLHTQMALFLCLQGVTPDRFKQETGKEMDGWLIDLRGEHRGNPDVERFVDALSALLPPG